jgi:putative endonuclease
MPDFRGLGRESEDRAAEYLAEQGLTIVTRRFCTRHGEVDIVALDGETLVFVEVKHRRSRGAIPEEAVSRQKVQNLVYVANEYLERVAQEQRPVRFDMVAIDRDGLRHIRDAF